MSKTELIPAVLFVCSGNTCRSVFAMYIARHICTKRVQFDSAGIAAQAPEDAMMAIETLRQKLGIDASIHIPRDIKYVQLSRYSLIVAMDSCVAKTLAEMITIPAGVALDTWEVDDPWLSGDYATCCETVELKLKHLCDRFEGSN